MIKMAFDPKLDKEIFSKYVDFDNTRIIVAVKCYNEGTKKLQITRENMTQEGETRFAKLGRMVKEEAEAVIPLMQEAIQHMD
ncbi:MAG: hypothetical protein ACQER9_00385 [Nanobdellota archaeon]